MTTEEQEKLEKIRKRILIEKRFEQFYLGKKSILKLERNEIC